MSRVAEAAIVEAARAERNRRRREENRTAVEEYAREIEREGMALETYRLFCEWPSQTCSVCPGASSSSICRLI